MIFGRSSWRRLLVWGVIGAIPLGLWFGIIVPIVDWKTSIEVQLTVADEKAGRMRVAIANLHQEKAALSAETKFLDLWRAKSLTDATARVQASLSAIAQREDIVFRSISPIQGPDIAMIDAVSFRVETELTLNQLSAFLKTLEYSAPLFIVERANIRRLARSNLDAGQPTVFVQLDIAAPVILSENGS
ncbi:type II secretion system (T2SS) protein M subtype b [Litoreibacter meonggei]|uniref:Type II secretion system (T2SS) protein M subtype b n=1 Tax=Litoreibacter meonggei TaxID=1049199 RepID=A0A497X6K8_9RHOB|nr:type II secretion system protein GspM [Litoreibacter meonggei]RLJ60741.1 type II secretion system (T2SS) protein M subtype b [Litoreibacter meonggei]